MLGLRLRFVRSFCRFFGRFSFFRRGICFLGFGFRRKCGFLCGRCCCFFNSSRTLKLCIKRDDILRIRTFQSVQAFVFSNFNTLGSIFAQVVYQQRTEHRNVAAFQCKHFFQRMATLGNSKTESRGIAAERDGFQVGAMIERRITHRGNTLRDQYSIDHIVICECFFGNLRNCHTVNG